MTLLRRWAAVAAAGATGLVLAGCDGQTSTGSASPAGTAPNSLARMDRAIAALGPSYRYDLTSSCGERSILGHFRVTVRHDHVVRARPIGESRTVGLGPADFPTITDLVRQARTARRGGDVRVTTDATGLPKVMRLDPRPGAIDDEACYRVARVRAAQDEKSR